MLVVQCNEIALHCDKGEKSAGTVELFAQQGRYQLQS